MNQKSLARYYQYLCRNLRFPFPARYHDESEPNRGARPIMVTGLVDPSRSASSPALGLLCQTRPAEGSPVPLAELELDDASPNAPVVDDYWYWLWNWQ